MPDPVVEAGTAVDVQARPCSQNVKGSSGGMEGSSRLRTDLAAWL